MSAKVTSLTTVCRLLSAGDVEAARHALGRDCLSERVVVPTRQPRSGRSRPPGRKERRYSAFEKTKLFVRDQFIDRYSGEHLIFPGVLLLLSQLFPGEFPYHPNWPYDVCHNWYWELYPTVDHIDATGADDESNWATTSMIRNLVKGNGSLDEHGWRVLDRSPRLSEWDGLMGWYIDYVTARPELQQVSSMKTWYRAAIRAPPNPYEGCQR
jgi:hypothetical protein